MAEGLFHIAAEQVHNNYQKKNKNIQTYKEEKHIPVNKLNQELAKD